MVKKKRTKKVSKKKNIKSRVMKKSSRRIKRPARMIRSGKRKINLSLKKLILFAVLALISFVLYLFLSNEIFKNLFSLLTMIFGFIAVGFLIVLLIFLILKIMKK